MQSIRTLLVGLALAPRKAEVGLGSDGALRQALWLARTLPARLVLIHSTFEATSPLGDGERAALEDARQRAAQEGVDVELRVSADRPWMALTRAVLSGEGGLVVVGKRDEDSDEGRRLGSQAIKLLRKCPAPVWVVKPEHDLVHKLVLAASDLSAVGDRAVELAAFVAENHRCPLHVVHAYRAPPGASELSEEAYAERVDAVKAEAQAHVDRVISASGFDGESSVHVGRNRPHLAIREAVEHLHPDLLVMGTASRGGEAGFLVGDTAERLLDRIDCSLLAVKPADFVCPLRP